ncbi:hypothetical protein M5K25_011196 [Dendrobium thyrsiflorum]|uniref:Thioredoxin domain-containing protein n=1 Tax=Dendrobium thyrsiflorum TaxID=117978 RepID=A0ABD0V925_DENTH
MAMKACFSLSTPSTEASAFHSHHHLIFSKKKPSANPAFFPYPDPKSFHFESTKKEQKQLFICRAKNIVDEVVEVTDETWKEYIIDSEIPVIVQFWAPSCGPCKLLEPVVGDLMKEYEGKVACYKINTDECLKMASQYGVRSIPTVLLFKDGKQRESITGAVRKSSLTAILEKYL